MMLLAKLSFPITLHGGKMDISIGISDASVVVKDGDKFQTDTILVAM
jgi:hypothetical protein